MSDEMTEVESRSEGFSGWQVFLIMIVTIIIVAAITAWLILSDIFTKQFDPVVLDNREEQVLQEKLHAIGVQTENNSQISRKNASQHNGRLEPEAYTEVGAKRYVSFSEREVNAMLARNTELADKLAIDLSGDLVSAKLLIPLDEEFPLLGGETLKVTAGVGVSYANERPVVVIKGVSLWGIPVPSAYLGDLKDVDLVEQYGDQGFWKSFSDGINGIQINDGELQIKFKP